MDVLPLTLAILWVIMLIFTKIAPITIVKTVAIFSVFGYNLDLCMQLHKE